MLAVLTSKSLNVLNAAGAWRTVESPDLLLGSYDAVDGLSGIIFLASGRLHRILGGDVQSVRPTTGRDWEFSGFRGQVVALTVALLPGVALPVRPVALNVALRVALRVALLLPVALSVALLAPLAGIPTRFRFQGNLWNAPPNSAIERRLTGIGSKPSLDRMSITGVSRASTSTRRSFAV